MSEWQSRHCNHVFWHCMVYICANTLVSLDKWTLRNMSFWLGTYIAVTYGHRLPPSRAGAPGYAAQGV